MTDNIFDTVADFHQKNDINSIVQVLNNYEFDMSNNKHLRLIYYYLFIKSTLAEFDYMPLMKQLKAYNDDTKAIYYLIKFNVFNLKYCLHKLENLKINDYVINNFVLSKTIMSYLNLYDFDIFKTKIIELYNNINISEEDKLNQMSRLKYNIYVKYIKHFQFNENEIEICNKPQNYKFFEIIDNVGEACQLKNVENLHVNINMFKENYEFPNYVNIHLKYIEFISKGNKSKEDILNQSNLVDYSAFGPEYQIFKFCVKLLININKIRIEKNYNLYNELYDILISKSNIKPKFKLNKFIERADDVYKSDISKDQTNIIKNFENKLKNNEDIVIHELVDYIICNQHNYNKVLEIFLNYKNYLLYSIFSLNVHSTKIGMSLILLMSVINTNNFNYIDEIKIILKYYEKNGSNVIFSKSELGNLLALKRLYNEANCVLESISSFGFELVKTCENNKSYLTDTNDEKVCIICLEELNNNIKIIKCNDCLKYISHVICLHKWLMQKECCPYCNVKKECRDTDV